MAGLMVCPECPACGHRSHYLRFDSDEDVGVLRCDDCDENIMVVAVLANKRLTTIKDPMAGELPEGVYYDLEQAGQLPASKVTPGDDLRTDGGQAGRCLKCGVELGAGYLCDACDTVEGWDE